MRLLLALFLAVAGVSCARAASPSFSSFDQDNFTTNNRIIQLRLTNTFGTLYVTNIYITSNRTEILVAGNTYITNLYVTNLYTTNIVINGTNAASQGDLVWTNVAGVIQPRPLQITNALLFTSGSADAATNTAFVIDVVNQWTDVNAGLLSFRDRGTNVAYVTPFGGYMSGRSTGQINPADTDVFIGVRDAAQGETPTAGFWVGAYDDAASPTNFGYAFITADGGPGADFVQFNMAAEDTNDASYFRVRVGSSSGEGNMLLVQRSATNFAVVDNSGFSGTGTNFLRDDGTYGPAVGGSDGTNTTVLQLGPFTPLRIPVANGTNTLTDGPISIPSTGSTNITVDGQIRFWGSTNIITRTNNNLVYTNGGNGVNFTVVDGNAASTLIGLNSGGQGVITTSSGTLNMTGNSIIVTKNLRPNEDNLYDIGTDNSSGSYNEVFIKGSYYAQGFNDGSGNYSRLQISHSGTNGSVLFNSTAAGTAGAAREFAWQTNGTTIAILDQHGLYVTNSAASDHGRFGVGTSELVISTDMSNVKIANGSRYFVMNVADWYPDTPSVVTLGGSGVEFLAVWTDRLKLKGMTKAEKALVPAADGMVVYQTDNTPGLRAYVNGAWVMVSTVADP